MSPQSQDAQAFAKAEQFRLLRNWAFGLAALLLFLGVGTLGLFGRSNPESATSTYAAFEAAGFMRWLFFPLMAFSFGAVVVGLLAHGLSKRRSGDF